MVFTHTDAKERYKQVFTGMFEVKGRWCVPIRALSKTDTVGVSDSHRMKSPHPSLSFHFFFPSAVCFDG